MVMICGVYISLPTYRLLGFVVVYHAIGPNYMAQTLNDINQNIQKFSHLYKKPTHILIQE